MIVLSGTIGAGKTSLTTLLSEALGTEPFYESVADNPILPLFYKDPKQYGFLLQIYFLNKRFDSIKQAMSNDNNVLDRSIYEDELFTKLNADMGRITQQEFDVYQALLHNMMQEIGMVSNYKKAPDLLIHIDLSLEEQMRRIKKRGRDYEQTKVDPTLKDYYQNLHNRYIDWYDNYDYSPKMKIDGDKYDFVENTKDRFTVLNMITEKLFELGKIDVAERVNIPLLQGTKDWISQA
nr:deoxynucleoside kinase [Secundilactobacillus kimchicus]